MGKIFVFVFVIVLPAGLLFWGSGGAYDAWRRANDGRTASASVDSLYAVDLSEGTPEVSLEDTGTTYYAAVRYEEQRSSEGGGARRRDVQRNARVRIKEESYSRLRERDTLAVLYVSGSPRLTVSKAHYEDLPKVGRYMNAYVIMAGISFFFGLFAALMVALKS